MQSGRRSHTAQAHCSPRHPSPDPHRQPISPTRGVCACATQRGGARARVSVAWLPVRDNNAGLLLLGCCWEGRLALVFRACGGAVRAFTAARTSGRRPLGLLQI